MRSYQIASIFSAALLAQSFVAKAETPASAPKPATTATAGAGSIIAPPAAPAVPTGEELDKTIYSLGASMSQSLSTLKLSPHEADLVVSGLKDALAGKTNTDIKVYGPKIQAFAQERVKLSIDEEKKAGTAYLEKAASETGAKKLPSGIVYTELKAGDGESPKATDKVRVHYRGTLIDGTEFDSSIARGQPAEFPLNGVIKCWTEGVQLMKVGGRSKLVCPSDAAYGDRGSPPKIKPGSTLVFEVELLAVIR